MTTREKAIEVSEFMKSADFDVCILLEGPGWKSTAFVEKEKGMAGVVEAMHYAMLSIERSRSGTPPIPGRSYRGSEGSA